MHDDTRNTIENHLSRIEDFAVAALDRAEDNSVLQSLLTEIKEKATAIHDLIEREG